MIILYLAYLNFMRKLFIVSGLFFFLFLFSVDANCQTDTDFWFVAPEATSAHGDRPIYLRFTVLGKPADIIISQPANPSFSPISISVGANSSQSVELTNYIDLIENKPANTVLQKGIRIQSTELITVYYEIANGFNTEIFAMKGRNALGTYFLVPFQILMNNGNYSPPANAAFDIVATEDNTLVTITPSKDIIGHPAGQTFTITLQKGETFSATVAGLSGAERPAGSEVRSNKPIAITVKDDSVTGGGYGNCLDLCGDQIVPVSMVGTTYISLPGYLSLPAGVPTDQVFILATQNQTIVTINGVQSAILQKGETFRRPSANEVLYIQSDYPVYVYHLSGFGCESGMALLPQIDCTGSGTVGFTRSTTEPLYMNILVPAGGENSFFFNGNSTIAGSTQFLPVPFTNNSWFYARILVPSSDLAVGNAAIVTNQLKAFHLSIVHGNLQTGCRYGYFSEYTTLSARISANLLQGNYLCNGDTLKLYCDVGGLAGIGFEWTGPNGFYSDLQNPVIPNGSILQVGKYRCIASKPACGSDTVYLDVSLLPSPVVQFGSVPPVCEGAVPVFITAASETSGLAGTGTYSGNGISSVGLFDPAIAGKGTHILNYRFLANNGCSRSASNTILVNPVPVLHAGEDRVLIRGNSLKLEPTITGSIQSSIWVPATGLSDPQSFAPTASPLQSIYYALIATTTDGCLATDTLFIKVLEKIGIPNAFSPNGDGINDTWRLDGLWGFQKARLMVFDRYGQLVFSASGSQAAWDGTRQGKPVAAGTYYYTLLLNAEYATEPYKGSVTVIR